MWIEPVTPKGQADGDVFFDEVRSDRSWQLGVGVLGTATLAAAGCFLVYAALTREAELLARVLVGGVIGGGLLGVFGSTSFILAARLLRGPTRVRIDASGVRVEATSATWPEISRVKCCVRAGRAVILFRTTGRPRWIRVPGDMSSAEAGQLLDALQEWFDRNGFQIAIGVG